MEANLELIDGGYNFIMLDADVYLTGTRHPLSGMRPLEDPSWEIQFQSDSMDPGFGQDSAINIGWYWARPTKTIRELFSRSLETWEKTHEWDQRIMNEVRVNMTREGSLAFPKSIVLSYDDYESVMVVDWRDFYFNQSRVDSWNNKHVAIHYTAVFNVLKEVLSKHFGQWFVKDYYTQSPRLFQAVNISGTPNQTLDQISLSVHLAKISERTYMWPLAINHTCSLENPDWQIVPASSVAEPRFVAEQGSWVEDNYLFNRKRYTDEELEASVIPFTVDAEDMEKSWRDLIDKCRTSVASIVQVDFSRVDISRLKDVPLIRESIERTGLFACGTVRSWGDMWTQHGCVFCE